MDKIGLSNFPKLVGLKRKNKSWIQLLQKKRLRSQLSHERFGTLCDSNVFSPRTNVTRVLMKRYPYNAVHRVHPSSWVQKNLFADWFTHFIEETNPTAERPIPLILDDYYSHVCNPHVIDMSKSSHMSIISLPPHSTHKMRLLDEPLTNF